MSAKDFKTKYLDKNQMNDPQAQKTQLQTDDLQELYQDGLAEFKKPMAHSRVWVISLTASVIFGFLAGIVGVIFFFSGSLSVLKISPEDLFPAQQLKVERTEQVNVLEDERISKVRSGAMRAVVGIFNRKKINDNLLDNVYLGSESKGNGFILTADGWIISTNQVVSDVDDLVAITNDGQVLTIEKIINDDYSNVVFLKVRGNNLITLPLANEAIVGEKMLVFNGFNFNQSKTIMVRLAQNNWEPENTTQDLIKNTSQLNRYLVLDQDLNDSFLGGPLINMTGEVVGLLYKQSSILKGVAAADFKSAINQVLGGAQTVERVALGAKYLNLGHAVGTSLKIKTNGKSEPLNKGALVMEVIKDSPASRAKLLVNDVIVKIGDNEINSDNDLAILLQNYKKGESVNLVVLRPEQEKEMILTVNF